MSIVGSNRAASRQAQSAGVMEGHRSEGSLGAPHGGLTSSYGGFRKSFGDHENEPPPQQQTAHVPSSSSVSPVMIALHSCVKVFCTSVAPSYMLPWMRGEESHRVGSGFAALLPSGERRLFTHAQVVENCTLVQVRRAVDAQKYVARVRTRACSAPRPCRTRPARQAPHPVSAHAHLAPSQQSRRWCASASTSISP